jgi:hypothetical protein
MHLPAQARRRLAWNSAAGDGLMWGSSIEMSELIRQFLDVKRNVEELTLRVTELEERIVEHEREDRR